MKRKTESILGYITLLIALLLSPMMLRAQDGAAPAAAVAPPAIELGLPFRDNAILQREMPVPVWGWSKPASTVTVKFAGQEQSTKAGADGKWMLKLKPLTASAEPAEMVVQESGNTITLKNILVGEVWHASGQSNMEWFANKSMVAELSKTIANAENELPIRELRTDTVSALYPQERGTSEAGWKTSRMADGFSALALTFANELHKELKVPVGILLTSHSNTRIEAFTERKAIEAHPALTIDKDLIHNGDVGTAQGRAAFEKYFVDLDAWLKASANLGFPLERPLKRPNLPGIAGEWRGPSQFFNGKISPVVPYAVRGSLWCQGESNEGDGKLYAARLEALVRGWRDAWGMPQMPFYFTQMQCYGPATPDNIGMADVRQAQLEFFKNNRENVGMVVQLEFGGGIHYFNKLHPGMRLARWALAKDYGRDIPYTGPIFEKATITGNKATVSFDKSSLFGGLMVGSKGQEKDFKDPEKYTEPARPTPGEKLKFFRLCGPDRRWHDAEAEIVGDTIVVTSPSVPSPIGVQYAHFASPLLANLYNKAGLPATPFCVIDGKLIYEEDYPEKAAARKARFAAYTNPDHPVFTVASHFRHGVILQRDQPIPVWGYANQGVEVIITLGGVTKTAVANEKQEWSVSFPALKASTQPITLEVNTSHGRNATIQDILIGDVWFLTGSTQLTTQPAYDKRDAKAVVPEAMPLVREFRRRTAASSSTLPRKRGFETGGDRKYRSIWQTADFKNPDDSIGLFAYEFAKALNRPGIPQGFVTMSSGNKTTMASPLSWTSFDGVKDMKNPVFQPRLDALLLQDPNSEVSKIAIAEFIKSLKAEIAKISAMAAKGENMSAAPLDLPGFPDAASNKSIQPDTIPTFTYNWCVSPLTPMGVSGVVWIPDATNIGYTPAEYASELEIYARSLPATYGQENVPFFHAQPTASLIPGITPANIPGAKSVELSAWPKSLKEIATALGNAAK
jgi:hypothetical protein